jgi:hypothetical protein
VGQTLSIDNTPVQLHHHMLIPINPSIWLHGRENEWLVEWNGMKAIHGNRLHGGTWILDW